MVSSNPGLYGCGKTTQALRQEWKKPCVAGRGWACAWPQRMCNFRTKAQGGTMTLFTVTPDTPAGNKGGTQIPHSQMKGSARESKCNRLEANHKP